MGCFNGFCSQFGLYFLGRFLISRRSIFSKMKKSPLDLADKKLTTLKEIMDDLNLSEPKWDAAKELLLSAHKLLFEHKGGAMALLEGAKGSVREARVDPKLRKQIINDIVEVQTLLERE